MKFLFALFHSAIDQLLWIFHLMKYDNFDDHDSAEMLVGIFGFVGIIPLSAIAVTFISRISEPVPSATLAISIAAIIYVLVGVWAQIILRKHNIYFIENRLRS